MSVTDRSPRPVRGGRRLRPGVVVAVLAVLALAMTACTRDAESTGQEVSDSRAAAASAGGASGSVASGAKAEDAVPDGFKDCADEWTGQSYHLCLWVMNNTLNLVPNADPSVQPAAVPAVTYRFDSLDIPGGYGIKKDSGGDPPNNQGPGVFYWDFGCRASCGPEATVGYKVPDDAPYADSFSVWANVEAGYGDDRWECRGPRLYTVCLGHSKHSDEGDYSVGVTYSNRPFLVQIASQLPAGVTFTKTTENSGNVALKGDLKAPEVFPVFTDGKSDRTRPTAWVGGFQQIGRTSTWSASYELSNTGAAKLDRAVVTVNVAMDGNGNPVMPRVVDGKTVTGDPSSTWCDVSKGGSTTNLTCAVTARAGNPDLFSFLIRS